MKQFIQEPRGHQELKGWKPTPMEGKIILYRSVSLPELVSIWQDGVISGGQNSFNQFDTRKWVFFGDRLSSFLIGQGEQFDRWASYALKREPIEVEYRIVSNEIDEREEVLSEIALEGLKKVTNDEALSLYQRLQANWQDFDAVHRARRFLQGRAAESFDKVRAELSEFRKEQEDVRRRYRDEHRTKTQWFKDWAARFPISSAVLQTKPLTGGVHYETRTPGIDDEYGFLPGAVTFFDLSTIHLVKEGKIIGEIAPNELGQYLEKIGLAADK